MKNLFPVLALSILLWGCVSQTKSGKEMISVSLVPQKYFLEQIAGDDFNINIVIPPGSSHAEYDPTPGDMAAITRSVAYLCIGNIGFEHTLTQKISSLNPDLIFYDLSENVPLADAVPHEHHHGHSHTPCSHNNKDAHIWMSARNGKIIAENIYNAVSKLKPERESFYKNNLDIFIQRLDSLDLFTQQKLANLSVRSFVIFHPALTYYARDYNLEQIPMEIDGKEPSVAWMSRIVNLVDEKDIRLILTQGEYSQASAQAVAETTGIILQDINPLSEKWRHEFEHITDIIVETMQ